MKRILVLGSGRSSPVLIAYLLENSVHYGWEVAVGDQNPVSAMEKTKGMARVFAFDVFNESQLNEEIRQSDVVVSLLPARFHPLVAMSCLKYGKHLITASYAGDEMLGMHTRAAAQELLFLNEMGVDPGIDHMSAMYVINQLRGSGHELLCFETFTGGLVAPESDNNPWHYKFTWNPRNVVLAGQGAPACFIQEGRIKYIPYHRLFRRTEVIEIEGYGKFEGYANRDSLRYIEQYNLEGVPTVFRGTLRRPGFCRAWDVFVQLGATDDSYVMQNTEDMTYKQFINSFLYYSDEDPVRTKLYQYMHIDQDSDIREKLEWLGIFDETRVGMKSATPAQILEHILKSKWVLEPNDRDMLVMWHKFIYRDRHRDKPQLLTSSLVVTGDDPVNTAMAKTVGLPLGIATKMILTGQIRLKGVHIPTIPQIYEPVLAELRKLGLGFTEKTADWNEARS